MAKIVFVGAMSHAPGATGWPEKADPIERNSFFNAAKEIGEKIIHAKPDVIIGFANDHVVNYPPPTLRLEVGASKVIVPNGTKFT